MLNLTKKYLWLLSLSFMGIFILFWTLGHLHAPIIWELKKVDFELNLSKVRVPPVDSLNSFCDNNIAQNESDTNQRVLLVGDSQLESLRKPVLRACASNGHHLVATVLWYGSTTRHWAETDTLDHFVNTYKPSYLIVVIGLNELFVNDLQNRAVYIKKIKDKIQRYNLKAYWVGPAAWKKDKGIIALLDSLNKPYFYPSQRLAIERAKDGRHPSRLGAEKWFDSVAIHITSLKSRRLPLPYKKDTVVSLKNSPFILLKPKYDI